jgi:hypothetical protein
MIVNEYSISNKIFKRNFTFNINIKEPNQKLILKVINGIVAAQLKTGNYAVERIVKFLYVC